MVNFWTGRRVLITGHTGFKGSWLSLWLNKLGAEIVGFSLKEYSNDLLFKELELSNQIHDERGDVREFSSLKGVFDRYTPELVFHLAAQPFVRHSFEFPAQTFETNLMGLVNCLECIRISSSVKVAVIVTSDKCYENREWVYGYRENDRLGGLDPYSASKACQELITASYRNSFFRQKGVRVATVRAGNVIGGGDWGRDRLIPDCVRALEMGKTIELRSPQSVRPWQHVLEPLSGYLLLAQRLMEGNGFDEAWNFGPAQCSFVTVQRVVEQFIGCWGHGKWKDISSKNEVPETKFLSLDISKSRFQLGWQPKLDINEAIGWTAEWYKNHKKEGASRICLAQIERYEKAK